MKMKNAGLKEYMGPKSVSVTGRSTPVFKRKSMKFYEIKNLSSTRKEGVEARGALAFPKFCKI